MPFRLLALAVAARVALGLPAQAATVTVLFAEASGTLTVAAPAPGLGAFAFGGVGLTPPQAFVTGDGTSLEVRSGTAGAADVRLFAQSAASAGAGTAASVAGASAAMRFEGLCGTECTATPVVLRLDCDLLVDVRALGGGVSFAALEARVALTRFDSGPFGTTVGETEHFVSRPGSPLAPGATRIAGSVTRSFDLASGAIVTYLVAAETAITLASVAPPTPSPNPIPLPAPGWLLAAGLGALTERRRRPARRAPVPAGRPDGGRSGGSGGRPGVRCRIRGRAAAQPAP